MGAWWMTGAVRLGLVGITAPLKHALTCINPGCLKKTRWTLWVWGKDSPPWGSLYSLKGASGVTGSRGISGDLPCYPSLIKHIHETGSRPQQVGPSSACAEGSTTREQHIAITTREHHLGSHFHIFHSPGGAQTHAFPSRADHAMSFPLTDSPSASWGQPSLGGTPKNQGLGERKKLVPAHGKAIPSLILSI